jgi:hypothetical protein
VWCNNAVIAGSDARYDFPSTATGMCQCNPGTGKYAMLQDCQRDLNALEEKCTTTQYRDCTDPSCRRIDGVRKNCVSKYSPYSFIDIDYVEVVSASELIVRGPMQIEAEDIITGSVMTGEGNGFDLPADGIRVLSGGLSIKFESDQFENGKDYSIYIMIRSGKTGQGYTSNTKRFGYAQPIIPNDSRRYRYY